MGYDQTLARIAQIQTMLQPEKPQTAAADSGAQGAFAAQLQQAMLAQGEGGDASAALNPAMAQLQGYENAPGGGVAGYAGMQGGIPGLGGVMPGAGVSGGLPAGASVPGLSGDLTGLDRDLAQRLSSLAQQLGRTINVESGFRSRSEQAELYQAYLNGTGNLAAAPGQSNHESGRAADVYIGGTALANVPGAQQAAAQLGLGFPVGGEPWHVELVR